MDAMLSGGLAKGRWAVLGMVTGVVLTPHFSGSHKGCEKAQLLYAGCVHFTVDWLFTIQYNIQITRMSFICHIHNYTEYNEEWNVFSAFNPSKCTHLEQWAADCAAPGEQSWTSFRSRDSNPQLWVTSGFKSNALSIRPTTALCIRFETYMVVT